MYFALKVIIQTQFFIKIGEMGRGLHAHCDPQTWDHLVTSFGVTFKVPYAYKRRMLLNSSETLLGIVRGKGSLKVDSIFWGHCMSSIYENLMETEADLVARTESLCAYIHKHTRCI
jgi:hypothetical protein